MKILFALSFLLALCSANAAETRLPDLSGVTDSGLKIEIYSELSPLRINQIHSWRVRILDSDSKSVLVEQLQIMGGMPEHNHGLPTQPQVTSRLVNGDYLLQGVRFHMQGNWQLNIDLQFNGVKDSALIEFIL
jgi:hypothetical protein